jgi:hypothetical protein
LGGVALFLISSGIALVALPEERLLLEIAVMQHRQSDWLDDAAGGCWSDRCIAELLKMGEDGPAPQFDGASIGIGPLEGVRTCRHLSNGVVVMDAFTADTSWYLVLSPPSTGSIYRIAYSCGKYEG